MRPVRQILALAGAILLVLPARSDAQRRAVRRPRRSAAVQRLTEQRWVDTVKATIDAATRAGGLERLTSARALVTRALASYPDDALLLHYDGFLLYRILTVGGASLSREATAAYLDDARDAFERSIARRPMAESYLLVSEIYGRQIAANPSRGATLGPNMALARARAMSLGAKNPRVFLLAGIAAIYSPPEAGGGLKPAEQLLRESVALFANDHPRPSDPSWGRAEAYAWLGQVYQRTGRKAAAAAAYSKALAIEPDNAWVRDVLLPGTR